MQVISNLVKKADWGVLARNANLVYVGSKSLYKVFDWQVLQSVGEETLIPALNNVLVDLKTKS